MAEEVDVKTRGIKSSSELFGPVGAPRELHGRAQVFTNERNITANNVLAELNRVLPTHQRNREEEVYLEKYLRGIQPILNRVKKYNDHVNNRIVVNIANEIVTFKTAEFAGEPIQYVSRGSKKSIPKKIERLNSMMISEGKQSKDMDLAYKMFTNGVAYRLVLNDKAEKAVKGDLLDEAPFEVYIPDPRNTFVVRLNDVTKQVVMGVTYVYVTDTSVHYTVYTETECFVLEGTNQRATKLIDHTVHNLGMVPLIEYPCNSIFMGSFEVVLPLLDAINATQSNRLDGVEQFIQAIMVFEGVDITADQLTELKELGAIKLPSGKVYYLNEQLDQDQTQTLVDDLYQTILQIVGMPSQGSGNTSDSSNNGAVILKNGWWSAEARALETEGMWRQAETEFLKIALKICSDANVLTGLAVSDVECKFSRRSYQDLMTKTQSFATLLSSGAPPIQAYTISGLVSDPEASAIQYDEYNQQREAELTNSLLEVTSREGAGTVQTGRQRAGATDQTNSEEDSTD